jgi:hypothetical protein
MTADPPILAPLKDLRVTSAKVPSPSGKPLMYLNKIFVAESSSATPQGKVDVDKPDTEPEDHFVSQIHCQSKKSNESRV